MSMVAITKELFVRTAISSEMECYAWCRIAPCCASSGMYQPANTTPTDLCAWKAPTVDMVHTAELLGALPCQGRAVELEQLSLLC